MGESPRLAALTAHAVGKSLHLLAEKAEYMAATGEPARLPLPLDRELCHTRALLHFDSSKYCARQGPVQVSKVSASSYQRTTICLAQQEAFSNRFSCCVYSSDYFAGHKAELEKLRM